jgi:hypothetical protein
MKTSSGRSNPPYARFPVGLVPNLSRLDDGAGYRDRE